MIPLSSILRFLFSIAAATTILAANLKNGIGLAAVASVGAFVLAYLLGSLPMILSDYVRTRRIKASDDESLIDWLSKDFPDSPWIISELIKRGHNVEEFKEYVLDQLRATWDIRQKIGLMNLKLWFPDLAKELGDYDPAQPSPDCLNRLKSMTWMNQNKE